MVTLNALNVTWVLTSSAWIVQNQEYALAVKKDSLQKMEHAIHAKKAVLNAKVQCALRVSEDMYWLEAIVKSAAII